VARKRTISFLYFSTQKHIYRGRYILVHVATRGVKKTRTMALKLPEVSFCSLILLLEMNVRRRLAHSSWHLDSLQPALSQRYRNARGEHERYIHGVTNVLSLLNMTCTAVSGNSKRDSDDIPMTCNEFLLICLHSYTADHHHYCFEPEKRSFKRHPLRRNYYLQKMSGID
jgi:hypothetical protein